MSSSSSSKCRDTEMKNPMMAGFNVEPINDSIHKFHVDFHGPADNLATVFKIYLPLLLKEPNPSDPMNDDAAALFMSDRPAYDAKVIECCDQYAKLKDDGGVPPEEPGFEEPSEDGSSAAGPVDP